MGTSIEFRLAKEAHLSILGVNITDDTVTGAVARMEQLLRRPGLRTLFFVNAHTLNLAAEDAEYRDILNSADLVFGDGTGVRWAARARGFTLRANLNGTDLTPLLLRRLQGRGLRVFLLGAEEAVVQRAAATLSRLFPGWTVAGCHHGYFGEAESDRVVEEINHARADLLLVGMGNPRQERWIFANRQRLRAGLAMGVGGLFHYWSGDLDRAPVWIRRRGFEWLYILKQHPHKCRRYLLGNPKFLARMLMSAPLEYSGRMAQG
jgi:N-acetylglucosaminyldiphosphoundecaprenol N-acetyl-beta-D-mannosaminyltransferase